MPFPARLFQRRVPTIASTVLDRRSEFQQMLQNRRVDPVRMARDLARDIELDASARYRIGRL